MRVSEVEQNVSPFFVKTIEQPAALYYDGQHHGGYYQPPPLPPTFHRPPPEYHHRYHDDRYYDDRQYDDRRYYNDRRLLGRYEPHYDNYRGREHHADEYNRQEDSYSMPKKQRSRSPPSQRSQSLPRQRSRSPPRREEEEGRYRPASRVSLDKGASTITNNNEQRSVDRQRTATGVHSHGRFERKMKENENVGDENGYNPYARFENVDSASQNETTDAHGHDDLS